MKYSVCVELHLGDIEASSYEEAKKKARALQEELAGSNDGSEMLANADLDVEETE